MINSYIPFKIFKIEIWAKHPVYTDYEASNFGRIRTTNWYNSGKTKTITESKNRCGYLYFRLREAKGIFKPYLSHRFIWECWNGLISDGLTIDHIDTIRTNNQLPNIRLGSPRENSNNPLTLKALHKANIGKRHSEETKQKISQSHNPQPIFQYDMNGSLIKEWKSSGEIRRETNMSCQNINSVCKGLRRQAYGYIWRYKKMETA